MIILVAKSPAWGAADNFYRAFKSQGIDVTLLCHDFDKYKRTESEDIVTILNEENADFWFERMRRKKKIVFLFGPSVIGSLHKYYGKDQVDTLLKEMKTPVIFITGTKYGRNYRYWNKLLNKYNFRVRFSGPGNMKYNPNKNVPLFHPMEYNDIDKTKNKRITVSHAPGMYERVKKKGTDKIRNGISIAREKVDFDYDHIVGVPLRECLERKAKSHIFIDQVSPEIGAVGKNGFEGIALGCVTLCSINRFNKHFRNFYYTSHPFIDVQNEYEVAEKLVELISNKDKLSYELEKVSTWKSTINYENTVNYVFEIFRREGIKV